MTLIISLWAAGTETLDPKIHLGVTFIHTIYRATPVAQCVKQQCFCYKRWVLQIYVQGAHWHWCLNASVHSNIENRANGPVLKSLDKEAGRVAV